MNVYKIKEKNLHTHEGQCRAATERKAEVRVTFASRQSLDARVSQKNRARRKKSKKNLSSSKDP